MSSQFALFKTRRFLPMYIAQFFSAFSDNLFKNALIILVTYKLAEMYSLNGPLVVTMVAGIYTLPFFVFSSLAGQLADKYEKSRIMRILKGTELCISLLVLVAFCNYALWWLVFLLFAKGTNSAFFGPVKYSILPQQLDETELVAGNGLVSAGSFVAILLGTAIGGLMILKPFGNVGVSVTFVVVSVIGFIAAFFVPKAPSLTPNLNIDCNFFTSTAKIINNVRGNKATFRSILGISWFWFLGSLMLAQCPNFAKGIVHVNEKVSTFFIVMFTVGVAMGSVLCNKLLKGKVSAKYAPSSGLGMSLSLFILIFACKFLPQRSALAGMGDFLCSPVSLIILASFVAMSACGGIFNVPLYALMQTRTAQEEMSRAVACLNVIDSFGMVMSAVVSMAFYACGATVLHIFLALAIFNLLLIPYWKTIEAE